MEFRELGNTREKIPIIGMGTWKLGVDPYGEKEALKLGIDKGMRFIDTAEMYNTEDIVGEAIRNTKNVFVATKVSPNHFHYEDVVRACVESLKRLKMKTIDLYQLHWPNNRIPISETMGAMERLVDEGKIRHIGVSNFSVRELKDAQESMKKYDIVSNQVEYSLLVRDIEDELLGYCVENKITIIAYSPFARGALFDKKYDKLLKLLSSIGSKYEKSAAQVALNWLVVKNGVVTIPKASDKNHVIENAGASDWKLRKDEMKTINNFLVV